MSTVLQILAERRRQDEKSAQNMDVGTIMQSEAGGYRVMIAGQVLSAECGLNQRLQKGDHVFLILGRGAPRIVGFLGPDEQAP